MFKIFYANSTQKGMDARVEIKIFTVVREVLCNYYQSHNLIGPHHFWGISPRNSTFYTRPPLAGRHMQDGHKAKFIGQEDNLAGHFSKRNCGSSLVARTGTSKASSPAPNT